ncbi:hypothetical protein MVEG_05564 [Podila verticillata NRRL 6337]|nr:hypothetical protein MVEG_05564 [Podila verticillata NRRL 6337]
MDEKFRVIIAGGGVAGLMLAALLERADIDFVVLERGVSTTAEVFGGGIVLHMLVLPLFQQLGLIQEIYRVSKAVDVISVISNEEKQLLGRLDLTRSDEMCGHQARCISRPELHRILLSQIPPHKIIYNKRVERFEQKEGQIFDQSARMSWWSSLLGLFQGNQYNSFSASPSSSNGSVHVHCTDGSVHTGSILVGADGARSKIRQWMYQDLAAKCLLPKSDMTPMRCDFVCLVGVTEPLDPEVCPLVKDTKSRFTVMCANNEPQTTAVMNIPDNKVAWMVIASPIDFPSPQGPLSKPPTPPSLRSAWRPDAASEMSNALKSIAVPYGGEQFGALLENTRPDKISKVLLEEKVFRTWSSGRVVLLGDACHKLYPSGGQGANQAIMSAVSLANLLYQLPSNRLEDVDTCFRAYRAQRWFQVWFASMLTKICTFMFSGKSRLARLTRYMVLNKLPNWVTRLGSRFAAQDRPQAVFLPFVDDGGNVRPYRQSQCFQRPMASVRMVAV